LCGVTELNDYGYETLIRRGLGIFTGSGAVLIYIRGITHGVSGRVKKGES